MIFCLLLDTKWIIWLNHILCIAILHQSTKIRGYGTTGKVLPETGKKGTNEPTKERIGVITLHEIGTD